MANYSKKTFLVPLKSTDLTQRLRDVNGKNTHTIKACTHSNTYVKPGSKVVTIQMKSESRQIELEFCDQLEARAAMIKLKTNLELICQRAKDINSPTIGSPGGGGGGTPGGGGGIVTGGQATLYINPTQIADTPFVDGESRPDITFRMADFPTDVVSVETVAMNGIELSNTHWDFSTPFTGIEINVYPPYSIDWDDEFIITYVAPDPS